MPNRIIKDSICGSEKINSLSDFQFRLWVGLITYVDDYGRGDARPAMIKGSVFPLRERVTVKDIESALHALAGAGCVCLYNVGGKPYLYFPNWEQHQRIQTKRPRYPGPEDADAVSPCVTVSHRDPPPESESESNTNPNTNVITRAQKFIPPTVEEVAAYCRERDNFIDPQHFIDYYEARNWMLGKTKMKDWKAAIRTWEQRNRKPGATISRHATAEDQEDLKRIMDKYGWGKGEL